MGSSLETTIERKGIRSPHSLVNFFKSRFVAYMDELARRGEAQGEQFPAKDHPSAMDECLLAAGQAHEEAIKHFLEHELGADLVSVPRGPGAHELTKKYIAQGREIIHQAALREPTVGPDGMRLGGYADFLFRDVAGVDWGQLVLGGRAVLENARNAQTPANISSVYYVCEVKMAAFSRGDYVIQAVSYADMLSKMTDTEPASKLYLWLGDNNSIDSNTAGTTPLSSPRALLTSNYMSFYRHLRSSLNCYLTTWIYDIEAINEDIRNLPVTPDGPVESLVPWKNVADTLLASTDDLSLVAGLRQSQAAKLKKGGVSSVEALAVLNGDPRAITEIRKKTAMPRSSLENLAMQASLQCETRRRRRHNVAALPAFALISQDTPGHHGLARLGPPSGLDVFFDMESYPLEQGGGLEYLLGATVLSVDGMTAIQGDELPDTFHVWWAHDRRAENKAFSSFVDWIWSLYSVDDSMRVYHYGSYEQSALRRLSARCSGQEGWEAGQRVEQLFNAAVFVDVYQIVRESLLLGEPSYSIKYLESLYGIGRKDDEIKDASSSVAMYYQWRCGGRADEDILRNIARYNFQDCYSLELLVHWLRTQQQETKRSYVPPWRESQDIDDLGLSDSSGSGSDVSASGPTNDPDLERAELTNQVVSQFQDSPLSDLFVRLLSFHRRESNPDRLRFSERVRLGSGPEATIDEEVISNATLVSVDPPSSEGRSKSNIALYRYDAYQSSRLEEKSNVALVTRDSDSEYSVVAAFGSLAEVGRGTVRVSVSPKFTPPKNAALVSSNHLTFSSVPLEKAVADFATNMTPDDDHWVARFLRREPVRLSSSVEVRESKILDVASGLDHSFLVIQGPPGTGKTSTCAHIIDHLVEQGYTVAVSSNSHASIDNLLTRVSKRNDGITIAKVGGTERVNGTTRKSKIDGLKVGQLSEKSFSVVGATVYQLCRTAATEMFDYLLVDEAGQVSLANLVSMGCCARNAILVGDQQQLEMPLKGFHEGDSGRSALGYIISDDTATVPPEYGIFLSMTYRLPESICDFLSQSIYDGRLGAHPSTSYHAVHLSATPGRMIDKEQGLLFVPRLESWPGDTALCSMAEISLVKSIASELVGADFTTSRGSGQLDASSILVVAPYNAQVSQLKKEIGHIARVGTVDKFQGQQAPVVIVSMCGVGQDGQVVDEDPDDCSPGSVERNTSEFVLRKNRLNVAISRAECLAIVVGSPELARAPCKSVDDIALVNFYCSIMAVGTSSPNLEGEESV